MVFSGCSSYRWRWQPGSRGRRIRWRFVVTFEVFSDEIRRGPVTLDYRYNWTGGDGRWRRLSFTEAGPAGTTIREERRPTAAFRYTNKFMRVQADYPGGTFYSNTLWMSITCTGVPVPAVPR